MRKNMENFDEILASGDAEAIEAALNETDISIDSLFEDEVNEELPEVTAETPVQEKEVEQEVVDDKASDKNDVVEGNEPKASPESSPAEEEKASSVIEKDGKIFIEVSKDNAMIDSKNSKHKLPYDLLEGARGETAKVKEQLEQQQKLNAELQDSFNETKRVAELHTKQLSEAGLDPKLLPEQMLKDPKLMAQVKEDYPQIGELVEALASQLQQQPEQAPEVAQVTTVEPFKEAFNNTEHLKEWQGNDADKWEMAKLVESQLTKDSSFDNKTPSELFVEIEKRVNSAFGDVTQAKQTSVEKTETPASKEPAQAQSAPIPNSPTDIGHQGSDMSANSQLLEQDASTMAASMEGMTEAEIETLLESVSDAL